VVICISLEGKIGHLEVSFDLGDMTALVWDHRWSVQVDLVVYNKQRIVCIHHIVID